VLNVNDSTGMRLRRETSGYRHVWGRVKLAFEENDRFLEHALKEPVNPEITTIMLAEQY
jgi:hypothetical protein